MTSEIKITGLAASLAQPAMTSAQVKTGRENVSGPARKSDGQAQASESASVRQPGFARAQASQDARFEDAARLRPNDKLLASAEEGLAAMKSGLEAVVKRYPPYPSNSPERLAVLNDVVGLRKQVEALLVPADPAKATEAGGGVDNERKQFLRDLMGLQEWPVDNISDDELAKLLGQVEDGLASVSKAREAMWADVVERASEAEVVEAERLGQDSGRELAVERGSISQDPRVLAELA